MKSFFAALPSATLLLGLASSALADDSTVCTNARFSEVRSLAGLPPALARKLGADRKGFEGIADRGGKFEKTDVVFEPLPLRRFNLAAVSKDCVLVALEQGGRGYSMQVRSYERKDADWIELRTQVVRSMPTTLEELIDAQAVPRHRR